MLQRKTKSALTKSKERIAQLEKRVAELEDVAEFAALTWAMGKDFMPVADEIERLLPMKDRAGKTTKYVDGS